MKADREREKLYAESHGYFWLPCTLCGQESGGHEWKGAGFPGVDVSIGERVGVCPNCKDIADELNRLTNHGEKMLPVGVVLKVVNQARGTLVSALDKDWEERWKSIS